MVITLIAEGSAIKRHSTEIKMLRAVLMPEACYFGIILHIRSNFACYCRP